MISKWSRYLHLVIGNGTGPANVSKHDLHCLMPFRHTADINQAARVMYPKLHDKMLEIRGGQRLGRE